MAVRSGATSVARTIALIGPTAAGVIDSRSIPRAMSASASSGRPPISPQIEIGLPAAFAAAMRPVWDKYIVTEDQRRLVQQIEDMAEAG